MGRDYCCIPYCSNYPGRIGRHGIPVKLYRLPVKPALRRAWLVAISRKNFRPTSYTRVCSDHFVHGIGPTKHDPNRVPSLCLAQKTTDHSRAERKRPANRTNQTASGSSHDDKCPANESETISLMHSYSLQQTSTVELSDGDEDSSEPSKAVQTNVEMSNSSVNTSRPEITVEDIKDSNEQMQFYTGLPDFVTFNALFQTLVEHGADKLAISTDERDDINRNLTRKLRLIDEFFLVLMRLRLGLLVKDLAYRFKVSPSNVSRIFNTWITFMSQCLETLIFLPSLETAQKNIPKCFEKFPDTRVVLDCTELFIQTPSSLENKSVTYSNYKSHNTFKILVGVNMTGGLVFLSEMYGGSASDTEITRKSGLFDLLKEGDAVMVDKGFIHIKPDLAKIGVKLYCPPFKTNTQFTKEEVELTRRIASARIHVERKMEQIKNFRILQGVIPLSVSHVANETFKVCAGLTNLMPPLVQ